MQRLIAMTAAGLALYSCGPAPRAIQEEPSEAASKVPLEDKPEAIFKPWQGSDTFIMVAPPELDAEQWRIKAKKHCGNREFCKVVGWASETEAASGFPMTDREFEAQVFSYGVNRVTGYDEALWDCSVFPRKSDDECLAK